MIWLAAIAWFASGASGFIFWWTKDYDLAPADLILVGGAAIAGPISWGIGYVIHGEIKSRWPVIMRRRGGES